MFRADENQIKISQVYVKRSDLSYVNHTYIIINNLLSYLIHNYTYVKNRSFMPGYNERLVSAFSDVPKRQVSIRTAA